MKVFFPTVFFAFYCWLSCAQYADWHAVNIDDNDGDLCTSVITFTKNVRNLYSRDMFQRCVIQSCLGGSRLPRRYRVWCWVIDSLVSRGHEDTTASQNDTASVNEGAPTEAHDVFSLVAQWDERMRSMQSGWGLMWLPRNMIERVSVRADRLHEVPADRDHALTCHPRLARWQGCHPVTVYIMDHIMHTLLY